MVHEDPYLTRFADAQVRICERAKRTTIHDVLTKGFMASGLPEHAARSEAFRTLKRFEAKICPRCGATMD